MLRLARTAGLVKSHRGMQTKLNDRIGPDASLSLFQPMVRLVRMSDIELPRGERPVRICPIRACSNDLFRETELHCSDEMAD